MHACVQMNVIIFLNAPYSTNQIQQINIDFLHRNGIACKILISPNRDAFVLRADHFGAS